jgi:hypothetical protein
MISYFIPLIAFWFARVTGVPQAFTILNRKPFACSKCMGMWLALINELCSGFTVDSLWIVPLTSFSAWVLELIAGKLKLPLNV